jgi:hypothetical protein
MSAIAATAIPEGKARGAGLRATMAITTAADWDTAPALDASREFIRLFPQFARLASSPHHRPSAPDARGSGPSQSASAPRQTGSAPVARCTPSRVRRRAASQVEFAAAVPARIAWCPDILRACRVCGLPWRMPYAPPMSLGCEGEQNPSNFASLIGLLRPAGTRPCADQPSSMVAGCTVRVCAVLNSRRRSAPRAVHSGTAVSLPTAYSCNRR